nr:SH3 domain-containing protein [Enterococcus entomosocium]
MGQDLESASSGSSSNSNSSTSLKGANLPNKGSYRFTATTNIRAAASTNSAIVGEYKAGQTVNYDSKVVAGGYVWLSWIGSESGKRRYSAVV